MTDRNPDLNRDNIDKVIARIRKNKEFVFNMSTWGLATVNEEGQFIDATGDVVDEHVCGTAACIAGFCVVVSHNDTIPANTAASAEGKKYLGLTYWQARRLFMPEYDNDGRYFSGNKDLCAIQPMDATADQAIRVLEHLRDTGEVDWRVAVDEYYNHKEAHNWNTVEYEDRLSSTDI
jgi:hypothetical protein